MVDLAVSALGLSNPFVIAASPATHGTYAILKSASSLPGAVTMRNYGHGAGDGSLVLPSAHDMAAGRHAIQSHALGAHLVDPFPSLEAFCEAVAHVRGEMPAEVKLWVSIGHFRDLITPGVDWRRSWIREAREIERAGADALELHLNTPGVAVAGDRAFDYYRLVFMATRAVKQAVRVPVLVKLPVESVDPLRAMEAALQGGADALGPTARWKGFVFDLDWRRSQATPGGGYGGSQALPVISYVVAEARRNGVDVPIYAGGGVFSWEAAAKLIMAGSQCVQLGSYACCLGPRAVAHMIAAFAQWMEEAGYSDIDALCGDALQLLAMPPDFAEARRRTLAEAYQDAQPDPDLCTGCGDCVEACWYDAIDVQDGVAVKNVGCVGCGYCVQVCPTGALDVPAGDILASAFPT
ncbi:MAG: 4Fe-4S binding protein [Anaerolineae bacterium]|nr:4Fe-4S binding protein [Anaerolineae bacterium]